jgi:hypothetical protein
MTIFRVSEAKERMFLEANNLEEAKMQVTPSFRQGIREWIWCMSPRHGNILGTLKTDIAHAVRLVNGVPTCNECFGYDSVDVTKRLERLEAAFMELKRDFQAHETNDHD